MKHMEGIGHYECFPGRGGIARGEFKIAIDISPEGAITGRTSDEKETILRWFHNMPFLGKFLTSLFPPKVNFAPAANLTGEKRESLLVFKKEYEGAKVRGHVRYTLIQKDDRFEGYFEHRVYDELAFEWMAFGSGCAFAKFFD